MQAEVWILEDAPSQERPHGGLLVDAPETLRETLLARLERYVVADDVVIEDVTGESELLHFPGDAPPSLDALKPYPCLQASRFGTKGWDVWVPEDQCEAMCRALGNHLGSAQDCERFRVARGVPLWGAELSEDTLPPEAGLDRTHVDYHKGCYIGQEVISRLKSVGHVNRVLHRFKSAALAGQPQPGAGEAPQIPAAGDALFVAGEPGRSVGNLTSVVEDAAGGFYALGYVKRGVASVCFETDKGARVVSAEA